VFTATSLTEGRAIATKVLESFLTCPVAEIARLGRTVRAWRAWRDQFLAYFTIGRASNGVTEAINGIIELHAASPPASATHATTGYG
jgi:transposase